mgnify:CR=1 FL=1
MRTGPDWDGVKRGGIEIPQVEGVAVRPPRITQSKLEHLIEVAIVNLAPPADAQGVAAHEPLDGRGVEGVHQCLHVGIEPAVVAEPRGEPRDRHVGDGVEPVEGDAEMGGQLALVIGFQPGLRTRQAGPHGVIDKMERQIGSAGAVSEPVEEPERFDAGGHGQAGDPAHPPVFQGGHEVFGVEVAGFGAQVGPVPPGVEGLNGSDSAPPLQAALPEGLFPDAAGGDDAHAGDDDASLVHVV